MKNLIPKSRAKTAYGLLSEVRRLILAEPKRYDQATYIAREPTWYLKELPACGTIGCVAGWVATLKHGKPFTYAQTPTIAASILGLGHEWADLFTPSAALGKAQSPQHARSGAALIRRFQKKYAKQLKAKRV